ncbi:tRNA uridine-5-carboxymethylaminomethyl(34) synthesis GTPase MnmE [Buchnera aphidicola]|uniref:tRNA uridine-5-carboxymethylaminomethyl(34) synthesis GTPase MnmE n=1 Tax=Buchnera aphidicola TaxID=9 RepID=UPI003463FCA1
MIHKKNDTIAARITPQGRGGVGILRISGERTKEVALKILGKIPKNRYVNYVSFLDGNGFPLDKGIALWFSKPNSYTGENVLELQGHGSPVVLDLLLKNITSITGVRLAKPGEFSERAFLNGKIDLAQAESIVDLINSTSEKMVRSSLQSLQGVFSSYIHQLMKDITQIRVHLEAQINFPEEEIPIFFEKDIDKKLKEIILFINKIITVSHQGKILREGVKVVIAGPANAGKSSLFNILSCTNSAIVNNKKGTTRDILREYIHIDGIQFELVDTAGLHKTDNEIEIIGIERAYKEIKLAEHILFVLDGTLDKLIQDSIYSDFCKSVSHKFHITIILNKSDLSGQKTSMKNVNGVTVISVSAHTGDGIELLRQHLKNKSLRSYENTECVFLSRRRHLNALHAALKIISKGKRNWSKLRNFELLAEDLRISQDYLGQILGVVITDDLLKDIFSEFCIGK